MEEVAEEGETTAASEATDDTQIMVSEHSSLGSVRAEASSRARPVITECLEPREVGEAELLAAVDVEAAELGAAVELGEDLAGIEDLSRVEGALHALLLVEVVLVEHHRHQVALLDPDAVLASPASGRVGMICTI